LTFYSFLCNLEATPSARVADLEPEAIVASLKEYPWHAPTPPPSEFLEGEEDKESEGFGSSGSGMTDDVDIDIRTHEDEMEEAGEVASNKGGEGAIRESLGSSQRPPKLWDYRHGHVLQDIESWRTSVSNCNM
jgi:hypothetical protein